MTQRNEARQYFLAHYADVTDECMVWPFSLRGGYGQLVIQGRFYAVHVLSCTWRNGPQPFPMAIALHGPCHNPRCWNGAHLSWGTHKQNAEDRLRDGTVFVTRGEQSPSAVLTEPDVVEIRRRLAQGESQRGLASCFGVSQMTIWRVAQRINWSHV